ncbi:MAG TPA: tetratricopeptide repeat protein [Gemmataceae bacterium]|nr:tetratricopeptide repeat protein [Gemmataceae bacterium]
MSIIKRGVGMLLLTAGLLAAGTVLTARADEGEYIVPECEMTGGRLASVTTWDPLAFEKLTKDFTVESARYSPADRRITWTLRTKKQYRTGKGEPEEVGVAEGKLTKDLEKLVENTYYCGLFYDAERRKVGSSEIYFTPGERDADDRFVVFADLNVANIEAFTAKVVVTLCERPPDYVYELYMAQGERYMRMGRFIDAAAAFRQALQARPGDATATTRLKQAQAGSKQP